MALTYEHAARITTAELRGIPRAHRPWGTAARLRAAERSAPARPAPRARNGSGRLPGSRHVAREAGPDLTARRPARARVAPLARAGERAGQLPRRALLAPGRPRASDRRGAWQTRARVRDEEHRSAAGASGESRERSERARARQPLPPPESPQSARGTARARVRPAERATAPREAASSLTREREAGPCELRALVRRLARTGGRHAHRRQRTPRSRPPAYLAAVRRLEASRAGGSRRGARRRRLIVGPSCWSKRMRQEVEHAPLVLCRTQAVEVLMSRARNDP